MPEIPCVHCGASPGEFHATDCPARLIRPQIDFRSLDQALKLDQERARKFDEDKVPLHLVDPLWLKTTAMVLAFGEKKYGAWNWARGTFEWHRLYRAAIGHLMDWYNGEDNDPESGLPHLWHANCCLMFLTRYVNGGMGKDDRPKFPAPTSSPVETIDAKSARPFLTNTPRGKDDVRRSLEERVAERMNAARPSGWYGFPEEEEEEDK